MNVFMRLKEREGMTKSKNEIEQRKQKKFCFEMLRDDGNSEQEKTKFRNNSWRKFASDLCLQFF